MDKTWSVLATIGILSLSQGLASVDTWTGIVNNSLDEAGNWSPEEPSQPPLPGDQVLFGSATSYAPTLNDATTFSLYEAVFIDPTVTYEFQITGSSSQLNFGLLGDSERELTSGVSNTTAITNEQSFTASDNGSIVFYGFSSAAQNSDLNVVYVIGNGSSGFLEFQEEATAGYATLTIGELGPGELNFQAESSAGYSTITVGNMTGSLNIQGSLNFYGNSTAAFSNIQVGDHLGTSSVDFYSDSETVFSSAEASTILVGYTIRPTKAIDGVLTFHGYSTAGQSLIIVSDDAGLGRLNFEDYSTAGSSTITLGDSTNNLRGHAIFSGSSTAGFANISVTNGSILEFSLGSFGGESLVALSTAGNLLMQGPSSYSLASLTSDSTSSVILDEAALTINYSGSSSIEIAGTISGSGGSLVKGGSGITILSGSCSYTGLTTVEEGKLILNGSIIGGALVTGGTLSGTGTIEGGVTVQAGTISPGNSPGTLTVVGDYTQGVFGEYLVQIEQDLSSLIQTSESAILDNSPLVVTLLEGIFYPNQPYLILEAADGIIGAFAVPSLDPLGGINESLLQPNASYNASNTKAFLTLQTTLENVGQTNNQRNAAQRLDALTNPNEQEAKLLNDLVRLDTDEARLSLEQLSGESYANWLFMQEILNQRFLSSLYEPLRLEISSSCKKCPEGDFTVWTNGGVGRSFLDSQQGMKGLHINSYEVSLGGHKKITNQWIIGIAGGYEQDRTFYKIGGVASNQSWLGGLYSLYRPKSMYLLMDFISGYSQNKVKRAIDVNNESWTATGKAKVSQFGFYTELGFDLRAPYLLFQPFLGVQGEHYHLGKTKEQGAYPVNLSLLHKSQNTANSSLGIHITGLPDACWGLFGIDCVWQHLLTSRDQKIQAQFQSFGDAFTLSGVKLQRNSVEGTVFVQASLTNCFNVFVKASAQKWGKASSCNGLIGVEASW